MVIEMGKSYQRGEEERNYGRRILKFFSFFLDLEETWREEKIKMYIWRMGYGIAELRPQSNPNKKKTTKT